MKCDDLLKISTGLQRSEHCWRAQNWSRGNSHLMFTPPVLARVSVITFDTAAFRGLPSPVLTAFHLHFLFINYKGNTVTLYYSLLEGIKSMDNAIQLVATCVWI